MSSEPSTKDLAHALLEQASRIIAEHVRLSERLESSDDLDEDDLAVLRGAIAASHWELSILRDRIAAYLQERK